MYIHSIISIAIEDIRKHTNLRKSSLIEAGKHNGETK